MYSFDASCHLKSFLSMDLGLLLKVALPEMVPLCTRNRVGSNIIFTKYWYVLCFKLYVVEQGNKHEWLYQSHNSVRYWRLFCYDMIWTKTLLYVCKYFCFANVWPHIVKDKQCIWTTATANKPTPPPELCLESSILNLKSTSPHELVQKLPPHIMICMPSFIILVMFTFWYHWKTYSKSDPYGTTRVWYWY